jgi:ketosteroid isomerase-like protein
MKATVPELTAETEVRALLDSYLDAVRALDVDRIVAHYAPEIVAYDAIAQLEFVGVDAYRAHWKRCLDGCQSMVFEPQEPTIAAGEDLAYGYYLLRCGGVGPDGKEQLCWMRATFAARKRDGQWRFVHEHFSMPFDPMTNQVLGQLTPQR